MKSVTDVKIVTCIFMIFSKKFSSVTSWNSSPKMICLRLKISNQGNYEMIHQKDILVLKLMVANEKSKNTLWGSTFFLVLYIYEGCENCLFEQKLTEWIEMDALNGC